MKRYRVVFMIAILAIMALGYFYYLSSKNTGTDADNDQVEITEVSKIINKDLESSYPVTPREVVELYSRIIKCYYNEEYTQEELADLTFKARELYDEDLLASNPYDEYYERLKQEIKEYKELKKKITTYIISKNSEVVYKTYEEVNYALLDCDYFLKGTDGHTKSTHEYLLRKDEEGRWKILQWELIESGESDE